MNIDEPVTSIDDLTLDHLNALEMLDKEQLIIMIRNMVLRSMVSGGIALNFHGKRAAQDIDKKVRPRQINRIKKLSIGSPEDQARNVLLEGENLQAMVTLYKERGQVDLILTDPPYNTGQYFRYNDRWDTDPNDPDLGQLVKAEDGSRHTKWMKAILPRLSMMRAMLKPRGILAICIDDNELFHLGMMLDELFGEHNRIAIINWQKAYAPKNDSNHVSTATEYILVYAKDKSLATTALEDRTDKMDQRYANPDNDPQGNWKLNGDATVATPSERDRYGIQSPFTGAIHYPGSRAWVHPKKTMKAWLEEWGVSYVSRDLEDGRPLALLIKGSPLPSIPQQQNLDHDSVIHDDHLANAPVIQDAQNKAFEILHSKHWPILHFGKTGLGRPSIKRYLNDVKKGKVPITYWAHEEYDDITEIGSQSWNHEESGHSETGKKELDGLLGKGHGFDTVKPLKLFKKIIQLWCPPNGLVVDPYAGSGTTGHAVLELNTETGSQRRFILIEQGRPEHGDSYAQSLTQERLRRAITGERQTSAGVQVVAPPLQGGFEFQVLLEKIDSKTVLAMRRDELIDVVITSHRDNERRGGHGLIRIEEESFDYLVGRNEQFEGYFLIWDGKDSVGQLNEDTYEVIVKEARKKGLKQRYHVYARYEVIQLQHVVFYKIPDKILAHLGFNEYSDSFNEDGAM